MRWQNIIIVCCVLLGLTVAAYENQSGKPAHAMEKRPVRLIVPLMNANHEEKGEAVLTETDKGVRIAIHAEGLRPGIHAVHFHEIGTCNPPDFMSAGNHFNPKNKQHGLKNPHGPHAGDMVNLFADRYGKVDTVLFNPRVTLAKGKVNSLRDADGSALIIHEWGDDQKTDPAGNSGARVLCGVVK
ncbi:MAG: superoxide dismutase family protein [Sporolactobacillus sp.]|nr:superoxide dismutase family protein [Sporolactobacillus sp.]MCI1882084.1 superoxide dismutase family protein [Sporolactobacillus sp.]